MNSITVIAFVAVSVIALIGWLTVFVRDKELRNVNKYRIRAEVDQQRAEGKLRILEAREKASTGLLDDTGRIIEEIKNDSKSGNLADYVDRLNSRARSSKL